MTTGADDPLPWAEWNTTRADRYTIGVEEEILLLDPLDRSPAPSSDWVLPRLSDRLSVHAAQETHASVIELATGIHSDVAGAIFELASLRTELKRELSRFGLAAASVGTYPLKTAGGPVLSGSDRYRMIADSMRALAHRTPTLALHVHIGVPDAEDAIRLYNGLRGAVPLLLALSANSPFVEGHDTGFASARAMIFAGFPRTGTARPFADYGDYVGAVHALVGSGALPDPSFLWWDVRLQPRLGTVEVRGMDAQTTVTDSASLVALVRLLAQLVLEGDLRVSHVDPEVLAENRFIAARDGLHARLVDPLRRDLVPVRELLDALLAACSLRGTGTCAAELELAKGLVAPNGANQQRTWAQERGLGELISVLMDRFTQSIRSPRHPIAVPGGYERSSSLISVSPRPARPLYERSI